MVQEDSNSKSTIAYASESTCLLAQVQSQHECHQGLEEGDEKSERKLLSCLHFQSDYKYSAHRISIILSLSLLIFIIYSLFREWLALFRDRHYDTHNTVAGTTTSFSSFDYIVVGAGPSGIVAAVNLARRLEQDTERSKSTNQREGQTSNVRDGSRNEHVEDLEVPKVLLLESGTLSQSDVLKQLQKRKHSQKLQGNNNNGASQVLEDPLLTLYDKSDQDNLEVDLNEFDIPYLWNELSIRKDKDYLLHHWPIEETFLGRAIGGSGIHNAMINIRALPSDFDRWDVGNWTAKNIMPYFTLLETYHGSKAMNISRGKDGPLNTIQAGFSEEIPADPVGKAFIISSIAAGIPNVLGFNNDDYTEESGEKPHVSTSRIGAGYYEFNIRNGKRDSAATAFLSDDEDIPNNLFVWTDSTVQKILFDTTTDINKPKAIGVQYTSSRREGLFEVRLKQHKRKPRKDNNNNFGRPAEIILAAGAIMTPQILSNSGIGDGGHISDLKYVGKELQDHPVVAVAFEENDSFKETVIDYLMEDDQTTKLYVESIKSTMHWKNQQFYQQQGSTNETIVEKSTKDFGILGSPGFSAGAFLSSPWSVDGNPDLQLTVFPEPQEPHYSHKLSMKNNSTSGQQSPIKEKDISMLITVALLRPEGRSEVELAPPSFFHENISIEREKRKERSTEVVLGQFHHFRLPSIGNDKNASSTFYLTDLDTKRLSWGIEQVRKIQSVGPLSNKTGRELTPGSNIVGRELRNFVRNASMTNSHWCGSTRMGVDKNDSVVDEYLRVHGVDNLRIVDAGVMPLIPNGNTHGTTCVVALRAVDLILG